NDIFQAEAPQSPRHTRRTDKHRRRHSRKSGDPVTEKPQDFIGKTHTTDRHSREHGNPVTEKPQDFIGKTHTPSTVIPANAGIQQHNATGIYRKNPNLNGLDSRLRGNDGILSWGNLSETPNPQKPGGCRTIRPQTPFTHSNKQKEKTK
ncbi:TPA: hypothetical protein ACFNMG_001828, partial [Neisseria lactamica]